VCLRLELVRTILMQGLTCRLSIAPLQVIGRYVLHEPATRQMVDARLLLHAYFGVVFVSPVVLLPPVGCKHLGGNSLSSSTPTWQSRQLECQYRTADRRTHFTGQREAYKARGLGRFSALQTISCTIVCTKKIFLHSCRNVHVLLRPDRVHRSVEPKS
jgi:hypothetical protein